MTGRRASTRRTHIVRGPAVTAATPAAPRPPSAAQRREAVLLAAVEHGPMVPIGVAHMAGVNLASVRRELDMLADRGDLEIVGRTPTGGKPAPLYGLTAQGRDRLAAHRAAEQGSS